MKAVLISIQPQWCELIASGKKTIEVRKTKPKLETPFKVYIYCTKGKGDCLWRWNGIWYDTQDPKHRPNRLDGKVIGEFVCRSIFPMSILYSNPNDILAQREFPFTCLIDKQIMEYLGNGGAGYGWHISDLVIYGKPRELREFVLASTVHTDCFGKHTKRVTRPPQSWCYVESEGTEEE